MVQNIVVTSRGEFAKDVTRYNMKLKMVTVTTYDLRYYLCIVSIEYIYYTAKLSFKHNNN